ncbi:hypothetical protein [Sphingomonas sp. CLY1604]|uniref:hypothetical protein n=1 Tax=Sphingomonas sp. CLY1604 TaxID=3457786 RepID=UPI003FD72F47
MGMMILAMVFVLMITALACRANMRFRRESRLPMQWGITGAVTWTAPRPVALAFMPVLALGVLGLQVFMARHFPARAGQEELCFPVLVGSGVVLVSIQLLHFWLIGRSLRRDAE